MMKQKEAVFSAIVGVLGTFEGSAQDMITPEQRKQVCQILVEGFNQGKISLDREYDEAGMKTYVNGLVSNWLRKDTRLTGGVKYVPKNPGSRAGSGDATLREIRALKFQTPTNHPHYEAIVEAETARLSEIQASKVEKAIDFSALPAGLAEKFSK